MTKLKTHAGAQPDERLSSTIHALLEWFLLIINLICELLHDMSAHDDERLWLTGPSSITHVPLLVVRADTKGKMRPKQNGW